jgi:hypothetical protein
LISQFINNGYTQILAKLGWPIKHGELSSQLACQQQVKSLKGLTGLPLESNTQLPYNTLVI